MAEIERLVDVLKQNFWCGDTLAEGALRDRDTSHQAPSLPGASQIPQVETASSAAPSPLVAETSHTEPEPATPAHSAPWLEQLCLFPVKSCAGLQVHFWPVVAGQLWQDRFWVVLDPLTSPLSALTQKKCPEMRRIQPVLCLAPL